MTYRSPHRIVPGDDVQSPKAVRLQRCEEVAHRMECIIMKWPPGWQGRWVPHHYCALLARVTDVELSSWRQRRSHGFLNVQFSSAQGTKSGRSTHMFVTDDRQPGLVTSRAPMLELDFAASRRCVSAPSLHHSPSTMRSVFYVGVVVEDGGSFAVRRGPELRRFLGTQTDRTLVMLRSVDDQGGDKGWIAARLGARHDEDWTGLCHAQDALQRGMNYTVQRVSPPGVGRPENVALTVATYKVTWVMLRKRVQPRRTPAPADETPIRGDVVE
jgi:hypothetical protein